MLIDNPIQSSRILMSWQSPLGQTGSRSRWAVGELVQNDDGSCFRYLTDTDDFASASAEGFCGYPSIPVETKNELPNPASIFRRRLPPAGREDFGSFLERFGLASTVELSDLSLLAYTGARLPGDSFGFCETFDGFDRPFRYVFDTAGFRHCPNEIHARLRPGDPVVVREEPENEHDRNAVAFEHDGQIIGRVNRLQAPTVRSWLNGGRFPGRILRVNGRLEYPRLFVTVDVTPNDTEQVAA